VVNRTRIVLSFDIIPDVKAEMIVGSGSLGGVAVLCVEHENENETTEIAMMNRRTFFMPFPLLFLLGGVHTKSY
jgi:hypothetical protein